MAERNENQVSPRVTVDNATAFVYEKETEKIKELVHKVKAGDSDLINELYKEKKRLDPEDKFDHEEVFIGTGIYLSGSRKIK